MTRGARAAHALRRARLAALARASAPGRTGADWAVLAVALLFCGLYLWRLDGWLINDDEGSYLYAAWRIAGGELPYRDFLTPQLPAFLLPGAAVLRLAGAGVWHLRALAVVLALGAGAATFCTARHLFGPRVAALAGTAAVAHPLVFAETRTYRPDPFMLFLAALGVALFVRAAFPRGGADAPPARRWLAAAGAAFGLALLAKLFALLPLCACLAWLASDGRSRGRSTRALAADVASVLGTAGLVVAAGLGVFVAASGAAVFDAVLGHHLRQGAGMGALEVAKKGLALASSFLRVDSNGLLVFTAAAAAVAARRGRDRRGLFFAWQLPTVLAFFLMTRQLFPRHLLYLVPGLATLFAVEVAWLARGAEAGRSRPGAGRERVLAAALAAGLLVPWLIDDWHRAWEWESGTRRAGDFLQLVTEPSDLVLADYSELNFYGRRATTYSAASLSEGAARSGQIAWSDPGAAHRLADELDGALPALVLVDTATEYSQLSALRDWGAFSAWLDEHYGPPAGHLHRHHQVYLVYAPRERSLESRSTARFDGGPMLLGAGPVSASAGPDEPIAVRTAWQVEGLPGRDLAAHCTLVDGSGREWAQVDAAVFASGTGSLRRRTSSEWEPGELLADRLVLGVPPGTPPGPYHLTLALYDAETQARLEAVEPGRPGSSQQLAVGSVTVRPTRGGRRALPAGAIGLAAPSADDAGLGVTLLGRGDLARHEIDAGSTIDLDLWWSGRATEGDLSARVTLAQPDSGAVAGDLTAALGVPRAGSSTWPDRPILVRQRLRLPVSAGAADGTYELGVSLLRADGAHAGPRQALGTVTVRGRDLAGVLTEAPPLDIELDATFGGVAALLGLRGRLPVGALEASAAAQGPFAVDLVWQALATVDRSYKISLQLLDASGRVVAQDDAVPAAWSRPTTGWLPGEIIPDRHELVLPADLAAGSYQWLAAMYDPDSGARLPVGGRDGAIDAARLGRLDISR